MPLFRVTGPDRGKRILVSKNTLNEIVAVACEKLNLPQDQYSVSKNLQKLAFCFILCACIENQW